MALERGNEAFLGMDFQIKELKGFPSPSYELIKGVGIRQLNMNIAADRQRCLPEIVMFGNQELINWSR